MRFSRGAARSRNSPTPAACAGQPGSAGCGRNAFRCSFPLRRRTGSASPCSIPTRTSNFSFTNALGMISAGQARRLTAGFDAYPKARWIVALHHHLTEYPAPVEAFAERIGTALINGAWFLRVLRPYAARIVVLHGHRHIDWIGACGRLRLISAPSPVMAGPARRRASMSIRWPPDRTARCACSSPSGSRSKRCGAASSWRISGRPGRGGLARGNRPTRFPGALVDQI